jgi:CheY-like chemotaxis protein
MTAGAASVSPASTGSSPVAGGTVTIESSPSEGTTIVLYLPTTSESIERPSAAAPSALAETENGTVVLLADDNQSVRELATRMLSGQGYTVLAAASGTEALELARRSEQIDVLLTDVIMPGMTGGELADTLAQQRPGLPIVFMSGYSSQIVSQQGVLDRGTLYLEKPFTAQQLLEQLESALAVAV